MSEDTTEAWRAVLVTHKGHPWYAEDDPLRRTAGYLRGTWRGIERIFAPCLPSQPAIPPMVGGSITSMPPLVMPALSPQPMGSLAIPRLTGGVAATPEGLALLKRVLP